VLWLARQLRAEARGTTARRHGFAGDGPGGRPGSPACMRSHASEPPTGLMIMSEWSCCAQDVLLMKCGTIAITMTVGRAAHATRGGSLFHKGACGANGVPAQRQRQGACGDAIRMRKRHTCLLGRMSVALDQVSFVMSMSPSHTAIKLAVCEQSHCECGRQPVVAARTPHCHAERSFHYCPRVLVYVPDRKITCREWQHHGCLSSRR
jgi:hypothetical protein